MTNAELTHMGYSVEAKMTGASYPSCIAGMHGWQYELNGPSQPPRHFARHDMAWAFARRLAGQIAKTDMAMVAAEGMGMTPAEARMLIDGGAK